MQRLNLIRLLALASLIFAVVQGYGGGAPDTKCGPGQKANMVPSHGLLAQTSPAPYNLKAAEDFIVAGETITLTLSGNSPRDTFKGFLIQAKSGGAVVGRMLASGSTHVLPCGNENEPGGLTHSSKNVRSSLTFRWVAPTIPGQTVTFYVTIVKDYAAYWVSMTPLSFVVLDQRPDVPDPTTTTSTTQPTTQPTSQPTPKPQTSTVSITPGVQVTTNFVTSNVHSSSVLTNTVTSKDVNNLTSNEATTFTTLVHHESTTRESKNTSTVSDINELVREGSRNTLRIIEESTTQPFPNFIPEVDILAPITDAPFDYMTSQSKQPSDTHTSTPNYVISTDSRFIPTTTVSTFKTTSDTYKAFDNETSSSEFTETVSKAYSPFHIAARGVTGLDETTNYTETDVSGSHTQPAIVDTWPVQTTPTYSTETGQSASTNSGSDVKIQTTSAKGFTDSNLSTEETAAQTTVVSGAVEGGTSNYDSKVVRQTSPSGLHAEIIQIKTIPMRSQQYTEATVHVGKKETPEELKTMQSFESVKESVGEIPTSVTESVGETPTTVTESVGEIPTSVTESVGEIPTSVKESVGEIPTSVTEYVGETHTYVTESVGETPTTVTESVGKTHISVTNSVGDIQTSVTESVRETHTSATEAITEHVDKKKPLEETKSIQSQDHVTVSVGKRLVADETTQPPPPPTPAGDVTIEEPSTTTKTAIPSTTSALTRPTKTTTQQEVEGQGEYEPNHIKMGSIIYDPECGTSKGCFVDCKGEDCNYMVTWRDLGSAVQFEMFGKTNPTFQSAWIAVGFSSDHKMGDDSVTECVYDGGRVAIYNSVNIGYFNKRLTPAQLGLSARQGYYSNGILGCSFIRDKVVPQQMPQMFDLNQNYNIMFATGNVFPLNTGSMSKHTVLPAISQNPVNLQSVAVIGGGVDYPLVKLHGCLMILAWVLFVAIGIVMSRYYKGAWATKTFMSLKIWYQVHRACMVIALTFNLIAFIAIFVEVGGYSQLSQSSGYAQAHPILGIIITVLVVANPLMALIRPGPDHDKRSLFNWAHWAVGMSAYILSAICICFGFLLAKAQTPEYAVYIMIVYVLYIIIFDVLFEVLECLNKKAEKSKDESHEMTNKNGTTENGVANGTSPSKDTIRKNDRVKTVLIAVHVAVTGAFALVLVLVVAIGKQ